MQKFELLKHGKKIPKLIVFIALVWTGSANAQIENQCGQAEVTDNWFKQHPELKVQYDLYRQQASENGNCQNKSQAVASIPSHTIPVVFHILHMGGPENISDAQVHDAMRILNRDYQKMNADTINVVASFTNNIAKVDFAFELAKLDPDGNCTNGIIRHYTPKTDWDANDLTWFMYSWPRDKYLNIYIVRSLNIAATAYAFLPPVNVTPNADCIVCMHQCCGSIGTGIPANSRTITHEAAHWFDIPHIWGTSNSPGVACGDDGISDTPITKGHTVCALANANTCNPAIVENIQNYMDYAPCKIMFTNGQSAHMHTTINGTLCDRNNLSTPGNLLATGITTSSSNCIPLLEIAASAIIICAGSNLSLNSYTSNANASNYTWTANNGATLSSPSSANTSLQFNAAGISTITCVVSNANGSATASLIVTAINGVPQITAAAMESFETGTLPTNWTVLSPTSPTVTWSIANFVGSHGNQCMYVDAENAPPGSVEILQTPSYDFLNNPGSMFIFRYAYARLTTTHNDVFKVQASSDCGATFQDVYAPSIANAATGSGGVTSVLFVPTPEEWKTYDVTQHPNFFAFKNKENVIFRFYFREGTDGYGNRIYVDQINLETTTGVNEYTKSIHLNVFPNPVKLFLQIDFTLSDLKAMKLNVTTVNGSIVLERPESIYESGNHSVTVDNLNSFAPGIYFVNIEFDGIKAVRKIVIE